MRSAWLILLAALAGAPLAGAEESGAAQAPRVDPKILRAPISKAGAAEAAKKASAIVRSELGRDPATKKSPLDRIQRRQILVVRGAFDAVPKVLQALRVPFTAKSAYDFESQPNAMQGFKAVLIGSDRRHRPKTHDALRKALVKYVEGGGQVFSTDWVVEMHAEAFPGLVKTTGRKRKAPEIVIQIDALGPHAADPLLAGVLRKDVPLRCWLEAHSFDITIGPRPGVEVLLASPDLSKMHISPHVLVRWSHGKGRVVHALPQAFQAQGTLGGAVAMQRLIANFLLQAIPKPPPPAPAKK